MKRQRTLRNPRSPKRILLAGMTVALALILTGCFGGGKDDFGDHHFANSLRIPELLEPVAGESGEKVFELEAQAGKTPFRPDEPTGTLGINGSYLGPTLRADDGDRVRINLRNGLDQTTTMHWHGMHLPAAADGGPHQPIEPGGTWKPGWRIDQRASTLWYHPHPHGSTEDQVNRGMAGMFIVDDPESGATGLPDRYGVDDVPLIVQDRTFDDDGQFDLSGGWVEPTGFLGDEILVNGTLDPYFEVTGELLRLRLLNASSARIYNFGFEGDRRFDLVATDGGLLEIPRTLDRIRLSPGERAEILVRFEPGERVRLRSFEQDLGSSFFEERFDGSGDRLEILEFRAADRLTPAERPNLDVEPTSIEPSPMESRRDFELSSAREINGNSMDMSRIDFAVEEGATEVWRVENDHGVPHSFHVHDVQFEVLSVDGEDPPPALSGPKDTVLLLPDQVAELRVRFSDYADPGLPYMFHCHLLRHEDRGMMGQFVVAGERESPDDSAVEGHGHHD